MDNILVLVKVPFLPNKNMRLPKSKIFRLLCTVAKSKMPSSHLQNPTYLNRLACDIFHISHHFIETFSLLSKLGLVYERISLHLDGINKKLQRDAR